ncbi:MAG: hypothetical protein M1826_003902 [Phylliscum demangeonii]|nr:MAG: hypothetical protein M1826_003902 [Phylliscum demangeonii]
MIPYYYSDIKPAGTRLLALRDVTTTNEPIVPFPAATADLLLPNTTARGGKQRKENLAPADLQAEAANLAHFVHALGRAGHGRYRGPALAVADDDDTEAPPAVVPTAPTGHGQPVGFWVPPNGGRDETMVDPGPLVAQDQAGDSDEPDRERARQLAPQREEEEAFELGRRLMAVAARPGRARGAGGPPVPLPAASVGRVYRPPSSQLYLECCREDGLRVRLAALAARADVGPAERPAWEGEIRKIIMTMHQIVVCGHQPHVWSLLTPHLTVPRGLRRVVLDGISDLSCRMVERVLQQAPLLSMPRGGTHRSTNCLLYDWGDRFARSWDGLAYRQQTHRLHTILEHTAGLEYARVDDDAR